jgi:hypothetical protein
LITSLKTLPVQPESSPTRAASGRTAALLLAGHVVLFVVCGFRMAARLIAQAGLTEESHDIAIEADGNRFLLPVATPRASRA